MEGSTTSFSSQEDQQLGQYRTISRLAIAALVLGLLSALALSHPSLWLVPVLAFASALIALANIARRDHLVGRVPALMGMTIALFFGAWAVSQYFADRSVVYRESRIVAEEWLRIVLEGKVGVAHQAMLSPQNRQGPSMPLDEFYQHDEKSRQQKERFFSSSPASDLVALGSKGQIRFLRNVSQQADVGNSRYVRQEFEVSGSAGGDPLHVVVSIKRTVRDGVRRIGWQVAEIYDPTEDARVATEVRRQT